MSSERYSNDPDIEMYIEKTVSERVTDLMSDRLLWNIYQDFGPAVFRRSSVFHGLRRFLEKNNVRGDTCLEIGSWNGLTAALLSQRFRRVISIDIVDNPVKYEIAKRYGLNIDFLHVSQQHKAETVKCLRFDFAYLDGDHAQHTQSDFDLVKHCGRVLFHEYWATQKPVVDLVKTLGNVKTGGTCLALWIA